MTRVSLTAFAATAIGIAAGAAFGAVMDNIAFGIAIGVAFGIAGYGLVRDLSGGKDRRDPDEDQ